VVAVAVGNAAVIADPGVDRRLAFEGAHVVDGELAVVRPAVEVGVEVPVVQGQSVSVARSRTAMWSEAGSSAEVMAFSGFV
jgi:hypothetical protein